MFFHSGELLLDQQRYQDAVDKFDRAIEIEKAGYNQISSLEIDVSVLKPIYYHSPQPMNVLPLVNKGLALFQWKQDSAAAEALCKEALTIDSNCEAAIATLAQLSLQKGDIEAAVELFSKHADIARSEPELINALTYKYVRLSKTKLF